MSSKLRCVHPPGFWLFDLRARLIKKRKSIVSSFRIYRSRKLYLEWFPQFLVVIATICILDLCCVWIAVSLWSGERVVLGMVLRMRGVFVCVELYMKSFTWKFIGTHEGTCTWFQWFKKSQPPSRNSPRFVELSHCGCRKPFHTAEDHWSSGPTAAVRNHSNPFLALLSCRWGFRRLL